MVTVFVKAIFHFQYSPKAQIHDTNSGLNTYHEEGEIYVKSRAESRKMGTKCPETYDFN